MAIPDRGRKAGTSIQIDVQYEDAPTIPRTDQSSTPVGELDWNDSVSWDSSPGHACSDFEVRP